MDREDRVAADHRHDAGRATNAPLAADGPLRGQGTSLGQIRQIVDQQYGGSGAPGTQTALPPA